MNCQTCNAEINPGSKFCGSCGAPIQEPASVINVKCTSCSHVIEPGWNFCKGCGSPITSTEPSTVNSRQESPIPTLPKCPVCSTQIDLAWKFCKACGHSLAPTGKNSIDYPDTPEVIEPAKQTIANSASFNNEQSVPPKNNVTNSTTKLIAVSVVLILGICGYALYSKQNSQSTVIQSSASPTQTAEVQPPIQSSTNTPTGDIPSRLGLSNPEILRAIEAERQGNANEVALALTNLKMASPQRGDRKTARALNSSGLSALNNGSYIEAAQFFQQAITADPADQEVADNLGYAYLKAGEYKEAIRALDYSIRLNPNRGSPWFNLAIVLTKNSDDFDAIPCFLIGYSQSKDQRKTYLFVIKQTESETDPQLKAFYDKVSTRIAD